MQTLLSSLFAFLLLAAPFPGGWLGIYLAADRDAAVVTEVLPDSPAQRAGLQAGDEIQAVGDTVTPTRASLVEAIAKTEPGTKVVLKILRKGKTEKVKVELGTRPDEQAVAESVPPMPATKQKPAAPAAPGAESAQQGIYLGLSLQEADGKVVVERVLPDGPAAAAGVKDGEALVAVGDRKVRSLQDLDRALAGRRAGEPLELHLQTADEQRSVLVEPRARELGAIRPVEPRGGVRVGRAPRATPAEPAAPPQPPAATTPAPRDLDAEIKALREELQKVRAEIVELKKQLRRE